MPERRYGCITVFENNTISPPPLINHAWSLQMLIFSFQKTASVFSKALAIRRTERQTVQDTVAGWTAQKAVNIGNLIWRALHHA